MKEAVPDAKVSVSWRMKPESKADLQRIAKLRDLSQAATLSTLIREEAERLGLRKPLHRKG